MRNSLGGDVRSARQAAAKRETDPLPCPGCGRSPLLAEATPGAGWWAYCRPCGKSTWGIGLTPEEVVRQWNGEARHAP